MNSSNPPTCCYLSIGSNLNNRYALIQKAVFQLDAFTTGNVTCSSLYSNKAQGFEGPDFLNAVVRVETSMDLSAFWDGLRTVENALGKEERTASGYRSRPIDIDIVFFGDLAISGEPLSIPHPRYTERRFVLAPLFEIDPLLTEPHTGKTVEELLKKTPDRSIIKRVSRPLFSSPLELLRSLSGICIEGNIGVGKTTLAEKLSEILGVPLILERFGKNPFLPSYYRDPERFAFPVEMFFLYDRVQHWKEIGREVGPVYVSDYHPQKSQVFARNSLANNEFRLFEEYFRLIAGTFTPPELLVFLEAPEELLLEQIDRRGRPYERAIEREYLERIRYTYQQYLPNMEAAHTIRWNRESVDFLADPNHLTALLRWMAESMAEHWGKYL